MSLLMVIYNKKYISKNPKHYLLNNAMYYEWIMKKNKCHYIQVDGWEVGQFVKAPIHFKAVTVILGGHSPPEQCNIPSELAGWVY